MAETTVISPNAQLVRRLRAGDSAVFAQVYRDNAEKLINFAYNILQDREACRDIVHDVFLYVWLNRERIPEDGSLEAYLFGAARNQVYMVLRRDKVREGVFEQIEQRIWGEASTESLVYQRELQSKLKEAVQELPEKAREVYRLSREARLSHREIAERLNISTKTVENHLTSALKKIRVSLGDLLPLIVLFLGGK